MSTVSTGEFLFIYVIVAVFYFLTVAAMTNKEWEHADQGAKTSITRAYVSSFVWPVMLVWLVLYLVCKLFRNLSGVFIWVREAMASLWMNLDLIGLVRKGTK